MNTFICEKCGRVVEYRPGIGFIESGTCPECKPEDYFPPDDAWPYWFHKKNEASIINVFSFNLVPIEGDDPEEVIGMEVEY